MPGKRLYNPRSVAGALECNQIGSYWTNSRPYDEIYYCWDFSGILFLPELSQSTSLCDSSGRNCIPDSS